MVFLVKNENNHAKNRFIGNIGESVACRYLEKKGFVILDRNFLRKCGEIDIIAKKTGTFYFIEVKSVTYKTLYRPEDNVHRNKIMRLRRVIQIYITEKGIADSDWKFMVICVHLNIETRRAKINVLNDVL
jgi:putative endonuclease